MAEEAKRLESFKEFWPYYVGEHRNPTCRLVHYIGTTGVFLFGGLAALTLNPWLLLVIPVFAYGFAWFGHFFIEKNRPATFSYPLWSLFGDFKMYWYFLNGKMNAEVIRLYGHYAPDADAPLRVS